MIFYAFTYFVNRPGFTFPNPFEEYNYGVGLSLFLEIVMFFTAKYVANAIASTLKLQSSKFITIPVLFVLYYVVVWASFWLEMAYAAFLASAAGMLLISIIAYVIADQFGKHLDRNRFT